MTRQFSEAKAIVLDALGGVAPELDTTTVSGSSSLFDLDLDSLDVLDLLTMIEQRLGISLGEGVATPDRTIDDLAQHLTTR